MILIEENDDRFYAGLSTIEGAGYGLFAAQPLEEGDCLEIIGVQVKINSIVDKCTHYAFQYKFAATNKEPDRCIVPMGYAALINHSDTPNAEICAVKGPKKNTNSGQMVYRMIRNIAKDEEIVACYSEDWSQAFKMMEKPDEDWESFVDFGLYNLSEIRKVIYAQD
jgi:SET domain-containing protein